MPTASLCQELLKQYQCHSKPAAQSEQQQSKRDKDHSTGGKLDEEYLMAKKRRVVKFIRCWMFITREHFFQQQQIQLFLSTIHQKIREDAATFVGLQPELQTVARILELHLEEDLDSRHKGTQRWIEDVYGNVLPIRRHSGAWELNQSSSHHASEMFLNSLHQKRLEIKLSTIQASDELVFRVHCTDHTFATLRSRFDEKASEIKQLAARKLNIQDKELILVHVKSNGERIIFNDLDCNVSTSLSVNGRIFVCPLDHIDAISPLPEQDPFQEVYQTAASSTVAPDSASQLAGVESAAGHQQQPQAMASNANNIQLAELQLSKGQNNPVESHLLTRTLTSCTDIKTHMNLSVNRLEDFSTRDVAYCLTQLGWSLLKNMHEFELIYTVSGRHNFKQITANLNVFLRHFNEIQFWVVTQVCLSTSLSKRVQTLRKFIKIANQ